MLRMESVPRLRINRRLRQPLHGIEQKGKAYVSDRQTDGRTDSRLKLYTHRPAPPGQSGDSPILQ
jgi:hypothetical protein